jgi:hypothetical protein
MIDWRPGRADGEHALEWLLFDFAILAHPAG